MSPAPAGARRAISRVVRGIGGARVQGPDGGEPHFPDQAIYYANHSSHLDFVTLWAVMPPHLQARVRPIAAEDYWGSGVRRKVAEGLFNAYLVQRHGGGVSPTGKSGQIEGMTAVLDAGDSLIIFPEGTRGDAETVAAFHSGLYKLARHNPEIPVVPVTLRDLGRILPKGEVVPVPHLSTVILHHPLPSVAGQEKDEYLAHAREVLIRSLAERGGTGDDAAGPGEQPAAGPSEAGAEGPGAGDPATADGSEKEGGR